MHERIEHRGNEPVGLHVTPSERAAPETSWKKLRRGIERESSAFGRGAAYAWRDFKRWIGEIKTWWRHSVNAPKDKVIELKRTGPRATMIPAPTPALRR